MTREKYIDSVKGLCILCIVLLHYTSGVFPDAFNVFVGSFMITAFYVVAGWLSAMNASNASIKAFASKRFRQLGIPYLYWTVIILLFDVILWIAGYYDVYYIGKEIYKSLVLRGIGTLWFLPALMVGGIVWHILKEKNLWIRLFALFFTIGYQCIYIYVLNGESAPIMKIINAPFRAIYNMTEAWVGIAFGYYAYSFSKIILQNRRILSVVSFSLLVVAYMAANYYPFGEFAIGWHYLAPLIGPLGLIYLAKSVRHDLTYLNYWGYHSLNLMVTHYSITLVLFKILVENILGLPFYGWITLVTFFISIPIQHLWVTLVDKYARFTLGKK